MFRAAGYAIIDNPPLEALDQVGAFQVAVIAPGWFASKPFMDSTRADWDAALGANVEAMITTGQVIARSLLAQHNGGRIIFLSSVTALKSLKGYSIAGTSLAALHVIAQMAAVDLAPHGITVNVVSRGLSELAIDDAQIAAQIPIGRLSQSADVGALCVFLASDAASYITGAVIPVDGGYTLTKSGAGLTPID